MNPSKASGFITVFQGNPPTATVDFRPLSVKNTRLGEVLTDVTKQLNVILATLHAEGGAQTAGFEPAAAQPSEPQVPNEPPVPPTPPVPQAPPVPPVTPPEDPVTPLAPADPTGGEPETTEPQQ